LTMPWSRRVASSGLRPSGRRLVACDLQIRRSGVVLLARLNSVATEAAPRDQDRVEVWRSIAT